MTDGDELDEAAILEEAINAHHDGDQDRAIALCTLLLEADQWPQPLYFRGAARLAQGDHELALADLDRAIELEPDMPYFAYHDRGRALAGLGPHEEALVDYERAIALAPDKASTRNRMGTTLYELDRLDEALVAYAEAVRLAPDRADYHFDRGAVYLIRGQYDEAIADFTRAIEVGPEAHFYFSRGTAHLRAGLHALAQADLDAAINLDVGHGRAWYARGYVRFLTRQREQGEADFARAVELEAALAGWPYEERWLGEQRGRVERYLRSPVLEAPAWDVAPYLALWRVGGKAGLWVIVGDCPTDRLPAAEATDARSALVAFGQRWQRVAEDVLAGKADIEMELGPPEEWPERARLLQTRAELLAEFAAEDGLWDGAGG